jgi:hypothetical protein
MSIGLPDLGSSDKKKIFSLNLFNQLNITVKERKSLSKETGVYITEITEC